MNNLIESNETNFAGESYAKTNQNMNGNYNSGGKSPFFKLIIITIIVTVIIIGGFSFAFFGTDLFKSDRDKFARLGLQLFDEQEGFIESSILEYNKKTAEVPFEYDFEVTVDFGDETGEVADNIQTMNDMSISSEGQIDFKNNNYLGNIALNYDSDTSTVIEYMLIDSLIGLQSDLVGVNYIALDNSEEFNEDSAGIVGYFNMIYNYSLSSKEIDNSILTDEYKEELKEKYFSGIINILSEDKFIEVEEEGKKGYNLQITESDLLELSINILTTLKNDSATIENINTYISEIQDSSEYNITPEIVNDYLDKAIEYRETNLVELANSKQMLSVTLYEIDGKLSEINIKLNEQFEVDIIKTNSTNNLEYIVNVVNIDELVVDTYTVKTIYTGLESTGPIKLDYSIDYEENNEDEVVNIGIDLTNTISFDTELVIKPVENTYLINDLEEDDIDELFTNVLERFMADVLEKF